MVNCNMGIFQNIWNVLQTLFIRAFSYDCSWQPLKSKKKKYEDTDQLFNDDTSGLSYSLTSSLPLADSGMFLRRRYNRGRLKESRSVSNIPSDSESVYSDSNDSSDNSNFSSRRIRGKDKKFELTAPNLAKCLSKFNGFEATLLQLFDKCHFHYKVAKRIALKNNKTFKIDGEIVRLRPKIKLCSANAGHEGCQDPKSCDSIHICPKYAMGDCKNGNCLFGHVWHTNHNKKIFFKYNLNFLTIRELVLLFETIILRSVTNRELKVCENFNSGSCTTKDCPHLHLCLKFLARRCLGSSCSLNHNLNNQSRSILKAHGLDINESPRDIFNKISNFTSVKESIDIFVTQDESDDDKSRKTMWSHDLIGDVKISEICYNSVEGLCHNEESGCFRLHSTFHFYWQIKTNHGKKDVWVNLTKEQVLALEKAYCDPGSSKVDLPILNPLSIIPSEKELLSILKGRSKWEANFDTMKLNMLDSNDTLELRRICTEKTANVIPEPCIFKWYFLDKNGKWIEYGNIDSTGEEKLKCDATSDSIESEYIKNSSGNFSFKSQAFSYLLDLGKMIQTNQETNVVRTVRRRPQPHFK